MVGTITRETKGKAKRSIDIELVPLMVGSCLIHGPSNVACMQIMRFNTNRRSRTCITCQCNLPLYGKGLSTLKNNTNMNLEKLNVKNKDK